MASLRRPCRMAAEGEASQPSESDPRPLAAARHSDSDLQPSRGAYFCIFVILVCTSYSGFLFYCAHTETWTLPVIYIYFAGPVWASSPCFVAINWAGAHSVCKPTVRLSRQSWRMVPGEGAMPRQEASNPGRQQMKNKASMSLSKSLWVRFEHSRALNKQFWAYIGEDNLG